MNALKSKSQPCAAEFQLGLFADQVAALPAGAVKEESYGKSMKKKYSRERQYQKTKAENGRLQRQWKNSAPARRLERENLRAQRERLAATEPQTVTLVSCVSLKADRAAPARELYLSDWFKKARVYAENSGDGWFILSALYGLVNPDETIEPYNFTLNNQRSRERQDWAQRVAARLRSRIPPKSRIVILAGENYRRHLIPLLEDLYEIVTPMIGLGIGQQLAFLKRANEEFNRS